MVSCTVCIEDATLHILHNHMFFVKFVFVEAFSEKAPGNIGGLHCLKSAHFATRQLALS